MSMIISLGSNIGDRSLNLSRAKWILTSRYNLLAESSVYKSKAVDYTDQPDFLNQLLEFEIPTDSPDEIMATMLEIENFLGRIRKVDKGPRVIDLDVIFIGTQTIKTKHIEVPHPRWKERSFVIFPLKELPFFKEVKTKFKIPTNLSNTTIAI